MALTDGAVILPGTGHVLVGTVGSATLPTQAQLEAYVTSGTAITGFETLGHTSIDDLPEMGQDGGDLTTLSTWQATSLYTYAEATTDYVTVNALQVDEQVLRLYYGGGTSAAGTFELPDTPATQPMALLLIFVSGSTVVGLYAYKTSALRDDSISMESDAFTSFPIRFTLEKAAGEPRGVWIAGTISA